MTKVVTTARQPDASQQGPTCFHPELWVPTFAVRNSSRFRTASCPKVLAEISADGGTVPVADDRILVILPVR